MGVSTDARRPPAADEAKGYYLAYNSVGIIKRGGTQRCHWEAERNASIRLVVASHQLVIYGGGYRLQVQS